ncbi:MAG: CoA transferase [Myxococcota bacterium]
MAVLLMQGALSDVRVLDLCQMLAGPYAAQLLADLGADVIKVEPVTGDPTRRLLAHDPRYTVDGLGAYFATLNRNKRSVALDLKSEAGRRLFEGLVAKTDVVLSNFSVEVTERLRLRHADLIGHNPRLVTAAISGFGATGPRRHQVVFDAVAQAMGGGMSLTGEPGGVPLRAGLPIGDLSSGLMVVIGLLAALRARDRTGEGQHVDLAMHDTQLSLLNYIATMHTLSGEVPGPRGNAHPVHVPYDAYPTADGWLVVAVIFDPMWPRFLAATGFQELDRPEYRTAAGREQHRAAIDDVLRARFLEQPRDVWVDRLVAERVPCAPVFGVDEALTDVQTMARHMVVDVPGPDGTRSRQPGNPVKLSSMPDPPPFRPAPRLGEHTQSVLADELALDRAAIDRLVEAGVIGVSDVRPAEDRVQE